MPPRNTPATLPEAHTASTMRAMRHLIHHWLIRHRHPTSLALHAVGIPLLVAGLLLGVWQLWHNHWLLWWRPVGLIVASYILQGTGHAIEGNDMGEVILIKKLLGKPYTAIAPLPPSPPPPPDKHRHSNSPPP